MPRWIEETNMPLNVFRCIFLGGLLGAAPVAADSAWQADAFGLYRSGTDAARDRWSGLRNGANTFLQAPGALERLHFIAGPKSAVAGKDRVHLVVLGFDADGNLVADGTPIRIATGQGDRVTRDTAGGIADVLHRPSTVAGTYVAGAETDKVQSLRATYRVTADLGSIQPWIAPQDPVLPETLADIRLPDLVDRYGNPAEDGIGLSVWLTDSRGQGARLTGEATGGAGLAQFIVRDMTGGLDAQAFLGGVPSEHRAVESLPLRPDGPPLLRQEPMPDIGATRLLVGPFRTAAGHLMGDGVAVRLSVSRDGTAARVHDTWVRDGMAEALLPWPAGQTIAVRVESPLGAFETELSGAPSRDGKVQP